MSKSIKSAIIWILVTGAVIALIAWAAAKTNIAGPGGEVSEYTPDPNITRITGVQSFSRLGELSSCPVSEAITGINNVQNTYTAEESAGLSELAQCLTNNGAKFYGAFWCPHCEDQRDRFGDAKDELPYIECSTPARQLTAECRAKGIESFPTWDFPKSTPSVAEVVEVETTQTESFVEETES